MLRRLGVMMAFFESEFQVEYGLSVRMLYEGGYLLLLTSTRCREDCWRRDRGWLRTAWVARCEA